MGAWTQIYRRGETGATGTPLGYAILALKAELDFNGYGDGLALAGLTFGETMAARTRDFQQATGLAADGQIGPVTARALLRRRIGILETNFGIPDDLVCKVVGQESAFDPGAVNEASGDFGIVQIHAASHPTITLAEAFDPAYALGYLASSLHQAFQKLADWDCAVAAWHVGGGGADVWCGFHKPAHGGPTWSPNLFVEATTYVADVRGQTC